MIAELLAGRALPWIGGGLVLALAVTGGWGAYQASKREDAEAALLAARSELQRANDALRDTNTANDALSDAVDKWRALATPSEDVKAAAEAATAAANRIAARSAELRQDEETDRANPDCAALLAVDLARACPAIARGMRERAARGVPRSDDRGASPGGGEDGPAPDR